MNPEIRPALMFFLPPQGYLTGAPKRTLNLCKALRDHGFVVSVVASPQSVFGTSASQAGLLVHSLRRHDRLAQRGRHILASGLLGWARALWGLVVVNLQIFRLVRRHRPDLFWVRSSKGIVMAALGARLAGVKVVWDIGFEPRSNGLVRVVHWMGLVISSAVVTQYAGGASRIFGALADRFERKFHAIPPAIDLGNWGDELPARRQRDGKVLLHVGSLCERKNQDFSVALLESLVNGRGLDLELWIVGPEHDEAYARSLRRRVTRARLEERVKFLGWRDDVAELLAEADLLLLPSVDEGIPNAVQEAMALGCPVVASTEGGTPSIVENGVTGWCLDLSDEMAWVNVIAELVRDESLRRRVGQRANDYARDNFSVRAWGLAYGDVLLKLADGENYEGSGTANE